MTISPGWNLSNVLPVDVVSPLVAIRTSASPILYGATGFNFFLP